jgi:pyruvate-ferredoxin/flavodoxin oxidoreductase
MLARSDPERSAMLLGLAQEEIDERWHYYEQLAGVERMVHEPSAVAVDVRTTDDADLEDDDA